MDKSDGCRDVEEQYRVGEGDDDDDCETGYR